MSECTAGSTSRHDAALQFEILEARCCLSVAGSAVTTDADVHTNTDSTGGTGFSAGQQDGVRFAHEQMGLLGQGQTVVIIDSGIAYDHIALGGGWGRTHRVVGGWDFAEGDADPYDDAPGGLHGTHVAGIVGSDDERYPGVAPQVDLVALRVFDDNGHSAFSDVEQALQWVHVHRNDFLHPMTAVNLSLGSDWNSGQVPDWGVLEDELSQLTRDGILVFAAAGNDFTRYGRPGLTYPAASPAVLPVGSVDNQGQISSFSQRQERMLAALGEWVTSTAPDYLFGFNGITDDYTDMSGTSMAAPIVAGASVLVREALQLVGATDQSAAAVQQYLFENAVGIFDSVTQSSYRRLDLEAALRAVVGTDESSGTTTPVNLGTLTGSQQVRGILQHVQDQDYFLLRADQPGRIRIDVDWQGRPDRHPEISAPGLTGSGPWEIPVIAGQPVVIGVHGKGGIGRYDLRVRSLDSNSFAPAAAPANVSEYRLRWTADATGWQSIVAQLAEPELVTELVVRSTAGATLIRVPRPSATERITIGVQAGSEYEVAVVGQRPTAELVILDGDGNRVGSSGGGVVPLHATDGWGTSSQLVHWRGTTAAVDLDEAQERSLQEWLHELKRQNDRLPLQLARHLHIKADCFVARVDESWEHCAAPQRCTDFGASFHLPVVSLPAL